METALSFKEIKAYVQETKTSIKELYAKQIAAMQFVIVQVGDVEASNRYVRNKIKDCDSIGLKATLMHLPETASEEDLLNLINILNKQEDVTAFMVQFPLPPHISTKAVQRAINPMKDADGFNPLSNVFPCTPSGITTYLFRNGYKFKDKNAVIIGRSDIVGKPAAKLLTDFDCNVTLLHSRTSADNLKSYIATADLIIVATGHINTLTKDMFGGCRNSDKPLVIFDVGINFDENGKLVGDCEPNLPAAFQSPVPGGVGLLTRLQLLENIITLNNYQKVSLENERK